jgi:hypothetical protein
MVGHNSFSVYRRLGGVQRLGRYGLLYFLLRIPISLFCVYRILINATNTRRVGLIDSPKFCSPKPYELSILSISGPRQQV